jgi:methylated-DNA-[protein]-cysteine S-methyltransferase
MIPDRMETVAAEPLCLSIAWRDGLVAGLALDWAKNRKESGSLSPQARALKQALAGYAAGRGEAWPELPLDWTGVSGFGRAVLETLRRDVGYGRTATYGELAELAGRPGAARAVGSVMARNRWPLVYPCHRIIGSGGRLTGFGGAGLPMKEWLLKLEGAL